MTGADLSRANLSARDVEAADWVYLVEVGTIQLASEPIDLEIDGADRHFIGGVADVVRERTVDYATLTYELVVSVEVYLPDDRYFRAGLGNRPVKVSRVRRGGTYADRHRLAEGFVANPQYSSVAEPVRFGVQAVSTPDTETFPLKMVEDLYTSGLPESSKGQAIPWVYGAPGQWRYTMKAPVASVTYTGAVAPFTRTVTLHISSNRLNDDYSSTAQVSWLRTGDPLGAYPDFASDNITTNGSDGATLEIVESVISDLATEAGVYYIAFEAPTPTLPINTASGLPTLGNALRYLMGRMRIPIDWSAMSTSLARLDGYLAEFWIDDPSAVIYEWIGMVGEVYGFAWATGPDGNFLLTRPAPDELEHPAIDIVEGVHFERTSEVSEPTQEVISGYVLDYGRSFALSADLAVVPFTVANTTLNLAGDLNIRIDSSPSFYAQAAADRSPYGESGLGDIERDEAYWICDQDTAQRVIAEQVYWRGFSSPTFEGVPLDPRVAALAPGTVVTYTSSDLGRTQVRAYVSGVIESMEQVVLRLTVLPD